MKDDTLFKDLRKYKQLLDEGVITQEDFDKMKSVLLNGESSREVSQPAATENTSSSASPLKSPRIFPIAIAILIVAVIAGCWFMMSSFGKIQGSWTMKGIISDGETFPSVDPYGGYIKIRGTKWTLEIRTPETDIYTGTVKNAKRDKTPEGQIYYTYDLVKSSGSVYKAAFIPDEGFLLVCTSAVIDINNGMMFDK